MDFIIGGGAGFALGFFWMGYVYPWLKNFFTKV